MVATVHPQTILRTSVVALAGAAASLATPVLAQAGATMTISATVQSSCNLQAGAMAFGVLEPEPARAQPGAEAALALDCTPGTAFTVRMDQGQNGSRRMAALGTPGFIDYEIYRDAAGTQPWGDGVSGVAPTGGKESLAAYGRVTSHAAQPGSYRDIVTVTVEF